MHFIYRLSHGCCGTQQFPILSLLQLLYQRRWGKLMQHIKKKCLHWYNYIPHCLKSLCLENKVVWDPGERAILEAHCFKGMWKPRYSHTQSSNLEPCGYIIYCRGQQHC